MLLLCNFILGPLLMYEMDSLYTDFLPVIRYHDPAATIVPGLDMLELRLSALENGFVFPNIYHQAILERAFRFFTFTDITQLTTVIDPVSNFNVVAALITIITGIFIIPALSFRQALRYWVSGLRRRFQMTPGGILHSHREPLQPHSDAQLTAKVRALDNGTSALTYGHFGRLTSNQQTRFWKAVDPSEERLPLYHSRGLLNLMLGNDRQVHSYTSDTQVYFAPGPAIYFKGGQNANAGRHELHWFDHKTEYELAVNQYVAEDCDPSTAKSRVNDAYKRVGAKDMECYILFDDAFHKDIIITDVEGNDFVLNFAALNDMNPNATVLDLSWDNTRGISIQSIGVSYKSEVVKTALMDKFKQAKFSQSEWPEHPIPRYCNLPIGYESSCPLERITSTDGRPRSFAQYVRIAKASRADIALAPDPINSERAPTSLGLDFSPVIRDALPQGIELTHVKILLTNYNGPLSLSKARCIRDNLERMSAHYHKVYTMPSYIADYNRQLDSRWDRPRSPE